MRYNRPMNKSTELLSKLQKKGYKRTKNREAILDIIYSYDKPISALDILSKLKEKGLEPNKTTVYRKLNFLMDEHLIHEIMIDSKTSYYERSDIKHHHHMICMNCKSIEDFHAEPFLESSIQKTEEALAKKYRFKTLQHSFEFFGFCNKCN